MSDAGGEAAATTTDRGLIGSAAPSGRVAVTGASGFVGRHLVARLSSRGMQVTAMSRRIDGASANAARPLRQVPVRDYLDREALTRALADCDVVVHLAARAHRLRDADRAAAEAAFREANVDAAQALAGAARLAGLRRFVLISSIGVHGSRTNGQPFTDADAPRPEEPYAVSKWDGEQAVVDALANSTTELVVLRPPLVYGPGAPGNFAQLLGLVRRLPLVPLGGLHRQRSLIHIDNLCDAIELAVQHPQAAGRRFVLCDGDDVSVAEIARELAVGLGRNSACVVNVPEVWLRRIASLLGRGAAVAKLADELRVDASGFRAATGWVPLRRTREALRETAAASSAGTQRKAAHA